MSFDDLLNDIMKRKASGKKIGLLSDEDKDCYSNRSSTIKRKPVAVGTVKKLVAYGLGLKYGDIYFTKREAECMVLLLKGKTIDGVAKLLQLSPRTVEYYVKNMKAKIGCRTKFELIDLVHDSDFLKNIDF